MGDPGVTYLPVVGFPGYLVGDDGSVWSQWHWEKGTRVVDATKPWRRLKPRRKKPGYLRVDLYRDGKRKSMLVHRLVLLAFDGECPPGMEACHNNGIRVDNRRGNLRWDTPKNNAEDRRRHGTHAVGEQSVNAKLTEGAVRGLRADREQGMSYRALAKKYNIHRRTAQDISLGKRWRHLLEPSTPEATRA